jgi:hypothetical protein
VFVLNRLSAPGHQKDEPVAGFDNDTQQHFPLTRSGALELLSDGSYGAALTWVTLVTILFCSLALNHQLPSLSMPVAYKEERTEPALCRVCFITLFPCPLMF